MVPKNSTSERFTYIFDKRAGIPATKTEKTLAVHCYRIDVATKVKIPALDVNISIERLRSGYRPASGRLMKSGRSIEVRHE